MIPGLVILWCRILYHVYCLVSCTLADTRLGDTQSAGVVYCTTSTVEFRGH